MTTRGNDPATEAATGGIHPFAAPASDNGVSVTLAITLTVDEAPAFTTPAAASPTAAGSGTAAPTATGGPAPTTGSRR